MSSKSSSESTLSTEEVAKDLGYVIRKHDDLCKNIHEALDALLRLDKARSDQIKRLSKWNTVLLGATVVVILTLLRGYY